MHLCAAAVHCWLNQGKQEHNCMLETRVPDAAMRAGPTFLGENEPVVQDSCEAEHGLSLGHLPGTAIKLQPSTSRGFCGVRRSSTWGSLSACWSKYSCADVEGKCVFTSDQQRRTLCLVGTQPEPGLARSKQLSGHLTQVGLETGAMENSLCHKSVRTCKCVGILVLAL